AHNSSDVWANQQMFLLDNEGNPTLVGGVPPDYFSEDGQLWGNPLFNWDKLAETEYQWWLARLYFNFHLFNLVRIDHFRGLESFWAIPANSETAKNGSWVAAKGDALLSILKSRMEHLPIVAEDLGIITPEVDALRKKFDLPGMKVLQFAFSSDASNEHLPHNFDQNQVVYTGTHDNNTSLAWFDELDDEEKVRVSDYLFVDGSDIVRSLIELAWSSVAEMVIVPIQDLLGLGDEGRMNTPGIASGNWEWRCTKAQLKKLDVRFVRMLNEKYNRLYE
ncbi:MAG: 4-alpha-glucanotransferase, partial [Prolixibacteraceae bacterium]|nr:4-alpha-glucanotransferase [Prolixibacteraceae bacterium]